MWNKNRFYKKLSYPTALILSLFLYGSSLNAQVIISDHFQKTLLENKIKFHHPPEGFYKTLPLSKNEIEESDLIISTTDDAIEIRYFFNPINGDASDEIPNIIHFQKAIHLATNVEEKSNIKIKAVDAEELANAYFADSGMLYEFAPKKEYAKKEYCALLSLFKEGIGHLYVVFLTDDLSQLKTLRGFVGFE